MRVEAANDLKSAIVYSDIIVTCTPAKQFFLKQEWIQSGSFIAAVGADSEDKQELQNLITRAQEKLRRVPVQVPHEEHRNLHLKIYCRLENPFVTGILEAYWEAYEAVGLNVFAGDYRYLEEVWQHHQKMVEAICRGDYVAGYQALIEHTDLLQQRSQPIARPPAPRQEFE